ncbi:hypothetical protein [Nocardioides sp. P5_C9_2]
MNTPWLIALTCLGVGSLLLFRAVALVMVGSNGRFRGDSWVSLAVAFVLFLIGGYLLGR